MKPLFPIVIVVLFLSSAANVCAQSPEEILLKDYRPRSIFKIPETRVEKARYPVIDAHSHDYVKTDEEITRWVKSMDEAGVDKVIILSGNVGQRLESTVARYGKHPNRFIVWCGIDYSALRAPDFGARAIAELEHCHNAGATGVGELSDKGRGLGSTTNDLGIHIDDPLMDPIIEKCADLHMPINIHVGEDKWMYEALDKTNDGLMNAWKWRVTNAPGILQHEEVVDTLERAVKKHPRAIFIACHLANCCTDLNRIGGMLEKYPNLYADIGARFAELSPIPRTVSKFFLAHQDQVLYGTDLQPETELYRTTFRLLETSDEHFYTDAFRKYHWPMHAWALPDEVLRKVYRENALRMLSSP